MIQKKQKKPKMTVKNNQNVKKKQKNIHDM